MRVRTCKASSRQIQLREDVIRRFSLEGMIYNSLKVGAFIKKIQLAATICYDADIILLSEDISDAVNLPEDLQYKIWVEDGAIHIGPVIGLLVSEKEAYVTENRLNEYLKYMSRYDEVGGLL